MLETKSCLAAAEVFSALWIGNAKGLEERSGAAPSSVCLLGADIDSAACCKGFNPKAGTKLISG